ncbi:hypothetical protein AMYX_04440 [Anaeromyxobacter diazotrophicus]|uniref:Uncharacterized protein n=2 Tax=Anaeromyxobacter diazotrophicus TaxID=2590199 RepID=A0A7I9VH31_9BACT|nr:hypothetical protein AMYX_04440 [Anaeromyxobacter diazotrophicus]
MAGLGIGPEEFALFRIADPDQRARALEDTLVPALARLGAELAAGLSRVVGTPLAPEPGRLARRRDEPPEEVLVAFCAGDRGYRAAPHLALAVSRAHLHARVAARAAADRGGGMRRALLREAQSLARKGKPFRKLRSYAGWEHEELPELAPAHSAAFWCELADALASAASAGVDVGVAWPAEEARSLAVGDVLGVFRDLAPLYKLLAAGAAVPAPDLTR